MVRGVAIMKWAFAFDHHTSVSGRETSLGHVNHLVIVDEGRWTSAEVSVKSSSLLEVRFTGFMTASSIRWRSCRTFARQRARGDEGTARSSDSRVRSMVAERVGLDETALIRADDDAVPGRWRACVFASCSPAPSAASIMDRDIGTIKGSGSPDRRRAPRCAVFAPDVAVACPPYR